MRDWRCRYWQRKLALLAGSQTPLVAGSAVERHVVTCPLCQTYWQEIGQLAQTLPSLLQSPTISQEFEARLWEQLHAQPTPASSRRIPSAVAVMGLAVVLGIWVQARREQNREVAQRTPLSLPAPKQEVKLTNALQQRWQITDTKPPIDLVSKPEVHRKQRRTPRSRLRGFAHKRLLPATSVVQNPRTNWGQWGAWFATHGEYRKATIAYAQAWQESPDPRTAFVAGQTAELAGDTSEALAFYARSLATSSKSESAPDRKEKQDEHSASHAIRDYCGTFWSDNGTGAGGNA